MYKNKHCTTISNINTINQVYKHLSYKKIKDKTINHLSFRLILDSVFPYCLCNDNIYIREKQTNKSLKKPLYLKKPPMRFKYLRN